MGKLIAVANMKGGVGKTTMVVSLAEALAAEDGARVLVVDLDAQANASYCLVGDHQLARLIRDGMTLDAFLIDTAIDRSRHKLVNYIWPHASTVSHLNTLLSIGLLAASTKLRTVERELIYTFTERNMSLRAIEGQIFKLFQKEVVPLTSEYDYIIFDCAPGISAFTEVAVRSADMVIVPTIPDFLSTLGLEAFCNSMWRGPLAREGALPRPKGRPHVLVTRYLQNHKHQNETLAAMRAEAEASDGAFDLFETIIPQLAAVQRALETVDDAPTFRAKWGIAMSSVLANLVREVKEVLHAH